MLACMMHTSMTLDPDACMYDAANFVTNGRTNGRTDGRTDRKTDGQTDGHTEKVCGYKLTHLVAKGLKQVMIIILVTN